VGGVLYSVSSSSESESESWACAGVRGAKGFVVVIAGIEVEVGRDAGAGCLGVMKRSGISSSSTSSSNGVSKSAVEFAIVPNAERGRNSSS
jgi:hypothetical protein